MTKEIEQITTKTVCPFCNKPVSEIWIAKMDSIIGTRYAYICGECDNLLKLTKERLSEVSSKSFLSVPTLSHS